MRPVESWITKRAELRTNTGRSHWVLEGLCIVPLGLGWPVPLFGHDRIFCLREAGADYTTPVSPQKVVKKTQREFEPAKQDEESERRGAEGCRSVEHRHASDALGTPAGRCMLNHF